MAIDSVPNLLDVIKQHQLLEPGQLNEILPEARRFTEPRQLAQHMLKKNWLTPYQVNQIFQGQGSGLVLGQYRLLERLGEGGMGQVFKARHQAMGRIVALKVIRKDRLENETAVKRFRREIHAVAQLSHPNVVLAFDADAVGGSHFYVMEYVDGSDLSRLMKQQGALPVWQACDFIRQSALGLQHAHERGLVHRDIKPANLLLARADGPPNGQPGPPLPGRPKRTGGQGARPTVKILDLGLARLADQADATNATAQLSHDGTVFGTPDFMAPEQAKNSHNVDWRADIYSLGCTFYYLLAGKSPFASDSSAKLRQADTPRPLETYRRDVPAPIREIIQKLMAARPEERYATPVDLLAALTASVDSRLIQDAGPRARTPGGARGVLLVGGVALLALLSGLGCLGAWLFWPAGANQPAGTGTAVAPPQPPPAQYVKRATYEETILATLQASGLPSLEGTWYTIAPFDNGNRKGFAAVYPPETEIDLRAAYAGKDGQRVVWKPWANFRPGVVHDLKPRSTKDSWAVMYLLHELEVSYPVVLDLSLGSDDTLTLWLNGKQVLADGAYRGAAPDQNFATLQLQPGKNQLLAKVCQGDGDWRFYVMPSWPAGLLSQLDDDLQRDFPQRSLKYLADLPEEEVHVGHGSLGKNGDLGYGGVRVAVQGQPAAHSLSMHPPANGSARAVYQLGKRFRTFKAKVAINDTGSQDAGGVVIFSVLGDGKELWQSRPVSKPGETQDCNLTIKNVNRLELRTTCPGSSSHAHAVWLDPHVNR